MLNFLFLFFIFCFLSFCLFNFFNDTHELIYKTETDSKSWKTNLGYERGQTGGRVAWGLGVSMSTLLYMKWMANGDLSCGTRNTAQQSVITKWETNMKRMDTCITDSLCSTAEINTTLHVNQLSFNEIFKNEIKYFKRFLKKAVNAFRGKE